MYESELTTIVQESVRWGIMLFKGECIVWCMSIQDWGRPMPCLPTIHTRFPGPDALFSWFFSTISWFSKQIKNVLTGYHVNPLFPFPHVRESRKLAVFFANIRKRKKTAILRDPLRACEARAAQRATKIRLGHWDRVNNPGKSGMVGRCMQCMNIETPNKELCAS